MTSNSERHIVTSEFDWQGISLSVSFEANWLNMDGDFPYRTAHLEIRSIRPEGAPLPVTETGYRSHFVQAEDVAELGGPEAYVRAWLDDARCDPKWKARQDAARQMSLF